MMSSLLRVGGVGAKSSSTIGCTLMRRFSGRVVTSESSQQGREEHLPMSVNHEILYIIKEVKRSGVDSTEEDGAGSKKI